MTTNNGCCWPVAQVHGSQCNKMVNYVVLAEFDIDTGSTVRHQYPQSIDGYTEDWLAEHMLPEGLHNRTEDWTYIFLNRETSSDSCSPSLVTAPFFYGLNLVRNKADTTVRRGAVVKALAIFSTYSFLEPFKSLLVVAMDQYYEDSSLSTLSQFYESLNSLELSSIHSPNMAECCLMKRKHDLTSYADEEDDIWIHKAVINFGADKSSSSNQTHSSLQLPVFIPLHVTPHEMGNVSLLNLIRCCGESVMAIYHAIIMQQRVMFVGYNQAANDIASLVMSAVGMVSPPLSHHMLVNRTFPYANLSDLKFLEVKGYLSGVTNPMFQQHPEWFDLLCTLDLPNDRCIVQTAHEKRVEEGHGTTGRGKSHSTAGGNVRAQTIGTSQADKHAEETSHEAMDARFIAGVISGISAGLGEMWVRQQFYDYTQDLLVQSYDMCCSGASASGDAIDGFERDGTDKEAASPTGSTSPVSSGSQHTRKTLLTGAAASRRPPSVFKELNRVSEKSKKVFQGNTYRAKHMATVSGGLVVASVRQLSAKAKANDMGECMTDRSLSSVSIDTDPILTSTPTEAHDETSDQSPLCVRDMIQVLLRLKHESSIMGVLDTYGMFYDLNRCINTEHDVQVMLMFLPEKAGGIGVIAMGLLHANAGVRYCATMLLQKISSFPSTCSLLSSLNSFYVSAYSKQLTKIYDGTLKDQASKMENKLLRMRKPFYDGSSAPEDGGQAEVSVATPGHTVNMPGNWTSNSNDSDSDEDSHGLVPFDGLAI